MFFGNTKNIENKSTETFQPLVFSNYEKHVVDKED